MEQLQPGVCPYCFLEEVKGQNVGFVPQNNNKINLKKGENLPFRSCSQADMNEASSVLPFSLQLPTC